MFGLLWNAVAAHEHRRQDGSLVIRYATVCVTGADESGGDSEDGATTSSSYSSLSDLVTDIQNSEISGDTPGY